MIVIMIWLSFFVLAYLAWEAAGAYGRRCSRKLDALRADWNEETEWLERIKNV